MKGANGDRENYVKYLRTGNTEACLRIEEKYDLDGYPPNLVLIGLEAAISGKDAMLAVEDYIGNHGV